MTFNDKSRSKQKAKICRWHFEIHFLEWKLLYFDSNVIEICSQGPQNNNKPVLGQIEAWRRIHDRPSSEPNGGVVYWDIYASLCLDELTAGFITNHNGIHYFLKHYSDVIMGEMASQITNLTIVYSIV